MKAAKIFTGNFDAGTCTNMPNNHSFLNVDTNFKVSDLDTVLDFLKTDPKKYSVITNPFATDRQLLEVASKINIPWESLDGQNWHEDALICVKNKHLYEKSGCKFAPKNLALKFSTEQGRKTKLESFGCHGKFYYNQFKHLINDNI